MSSLRKIIIVFIAACSGAAAIKIYDFWLFTNDGLAAHARWQEHIGSSDEVRLSLLRDANDFDAIQLAAMAGDPDAQATLGQMLCSDGRREDGVVWIRRAAEQLHFPSIIYLTILSAPRNNAPADLVTATRWSGFFRYITFYSQEARNLTQDFVQGPCVNPEDRMSSLLFASAVLSGPVNYIDLARFYATAPYGDVGRIETFALATVAIERLDMSTRRAEEELRLLLAEVQSQMTSAEIDAARARAREWLEL